MQSDAALVKATIEGNRSAFAELVRRYERAVMAAALDVLGDWHGAEDAAQDCFVTAYQKLGQLRKGGAFGKWLLKIARHMAVKRAKKGIKAGSLEEEKAGIAAECPAGFDGDSQELLAAVMRLPWQQRQVVMLRYFGGWKVREIAEIASRPIGTITVQLSRAHRRLKRILKEAGYERQR